MCPATEEEHRQLADLLRKTLFYHSLNDTYIQKELCDMPGEPTFKAYFDQAVLSEQKRKSFQEVGDSGARLDPGAACMALLEEDQISQAGEVSINYSSAGSGQGKPGRGRGRSGSGGNNRSFGGNAFGGNGGNRSFNGSFGGTHNGGGNGSFNGSF